jgi:hypothetical protein
MKIDVVYVDLKTYKKNFIDDIEADHDGYPFQAFIGTNEEIEYENRGDVDSSLTFKEITEEEYNTIKKFFGTSFGTSALI